MASNLRTTKYRDGTPIPSDNIVHLRFYGRLYNWYAVSDSRGLCPTGWHVPSDNEWKELEMYLGMSQQEADRLFAWRGTNEGGKLKSTRTEPDLDPRWDSPNTGATNESGWSGLPAGVKISGSVISVGESGCWWSSTQQWVADAGSFANNRRLDYNRSDVLRSASSWDNSLAVRCIRYE